MTDEELKEKQLYCLNVVSVHLCDFAMSFQISNRL